MQMTKECLKKSWLIVCQRILAVKTGLYRQLKDQRGQGTTEYAILVGVLVVIAILAIVAFRPKLELLWRSITDAIEQL
ncbi:MAG: hypothetical protein FWH40_02210 [Coriobacteriia bacterium]|nr:hypothetical protein [Coriobacteriia bacterium]